MANEFDDEVEKLGKMMEKLRADWPDLFDGQPTTAPTDYIEALSAAELELSSAVSALGLSMGEAGEAMYEFSRSMSLIDIDEKTYLELIEAWPMYKSDSYSGLVTIGSDGMHVQVRELALPERLLASLLAICMRKQCPDWAYYKVVWLADRVFAYYDRKHYGED